jgi:hypothetical protein
VFDQNWKPLADYGLNGWSYRGFADFTKITSGDMKGSVALFGGNYRADSDLVVVNFEYQIATDLLSALRSEILGGNVPAGLANGLAQQLKNAAMLVDKKDVLAALNVLGAFQHAVAAQDGKGIPADLAQRWHDRSDEIVRGLGDLGPLN